MMPPLLIEMDLNDPSTTPTWGADITPYVRAWSSDRGTARELTRIEAGTARITLGNETGRFTPKSTSSVFYPNLLPMRRIRIRANVDGTLYPIFQGFVETWPAVFPNTGDDQVITVNLVDGFKVLSLATLSTTYPAQRSDLRVAAVLDDVGWPAGDRTLSTGVRTISETTLENVSALAHLQDVEKAESGRLYIGRDGKVVFLDHYGTQVGAASFGGKTWTDDGTGMSYRDIVLRFDDSFIINDAHVSGVSGTDQAATSSASITKYLTRSFVDSLPVTDNEANDYAAWLVYRYAEPELRIEQLADNALRHGQWDQLLARDLRDRVLVKKTPRGATTISQDSVIEGISHEWTPDEWRTTLDVSPTFTAFQGWILGDATYGLLGSTTILSW